MMEMRSERERYLKNPLRLLRSMAELAMAPVLMVGEAQDKVWDAPYNEENYPRLGEEDAPTETEWELTDPDQLRLF